MSGQEQIRSNRKDGAEPVDPIDPPVAGQAQKQVNTEAVDSILDDIDTVLESNAEEFVRNFVQKGGQ
jgi:prokaryotic ubiquitin-like protein Pup